MYGINGILRTCGVKAAVREENEVTYLLIDLYYINQKGHIMANQSLNTQSLTALGPAPFKYYLPISCFHAKTKTVLAFSFQKRQGLKMFFHSCRIIT